MLVRRLCVVLAFASIGPASALAQRAGVVDAASVAEQVFTLTNAFRQQNSLPLLARSPALATAARDLADYMARTDRYGHEADGREPAERVRQHGYDDCLVAENIAYYRKPSGFDNDELARSLVEGWKQSPPHRQNLLDADVTDFGAAVAHSDRSGRWYGVQVFGLPASAAIRFEIANRADVPVDYRLGEKRYTLPPRVTRTHEGCRRSELVVDWPGGGATASARPAGGDRYAFVRDRDGRWRMDTD